MKVIVDEYDGAFSINLEAETLKDAAWLALWNLNAKAVVPLREVSAYQDGSFNGWLSWPKRSDHTSEIKR